MKYSRAEIQQYNSANIFENRSILPWLSWGELGCRIKKGSGQEIKNRGLND